MRFRSYHRDADGGLYRCINYDNITRDMGSITMAKAIQHIRNMGKGGMINPHEIVRVE